MRTYSILLLLSSCVLSCTPREVPPDVRSILLEQLRNTHTNQDWFVPAKIAVQGLSAAQSNWKDSTDNHSIGELVSHLIFWNERILIAFAGNTLPDFDDNNETTFQLFDGDEWDNATRQLDSIQIRWEQAVETASVQQLQEWSSSIANICSHNAYHIGQIVYIRKRNGWWD